MDIREMAGGWNGSKLHLVVGFGISGVENSYSVTCELILLGYG
jgi:hypothetical protein